MKQPVESYINEGLRRDEAEHDQYSTRKLTDALKRRGVAEEALREALAEVEHSDQ